MPNTLLKDESDRRSVFQGELPNCGAEISGLHGWPDFLRFCLLQLPALFCWSSSVGSQVTSELCQ